MARFAGNRTRLSVGANYNGVQKDFFFQPLDTLVVELPAAAIVHAMLSHEFAPGMTGFVRGENVFNKQHEEVFSYRAPGAAVYAGLKLRTVD